MDAHEEVKIAVRNDVLTLTIMPTERCNFRCVYCYEDFSKGRMSRKIISGLKKALLGRLPGLRYLELRWFGGEPLLAKDIIYEIHDIVNLYRRPDTCFVGKITTNGFDLDYDTFLKMVSCGVKVFSISFDGLGDIHNTTRRHAKDGVNTFDRIYKNLKAMKDSDEDFQVSLRIHHTPKSIKYIESFIEMLKSDFLSDKRFTPFVESIKYLGGPKTMYQYTSEEEADSGDKLVFSILGFKPQDKAKFICHAAKPNSFVIRSDGSLTKCTVALDQRIGKLESDGTFVIDNELASKWTRNIFTGYSEFNRCPLSFLRKSSLSSSVTDIKPIKFNSIALHKEL